MRTVMDVIEEIGIEGVGDLSAKAEAGFMKTDLGESEFPTSRWLAGRISSYLVEEMTEGHTLSAVLFVLDMGYRIREYEEARQTAGVVMSEEPR